MAKNLNEKQTQFISVLKAHKGEELTLAEISALLGFEVKSGTINCLLAGENALVEHGQEKAVQVVVTKKVMTYKIKG